MKAAIRIGWVMLCASGLLSGCNGIKGYTFESTADASSDGPSAPSYTLAGTVSGLTTGSTGFTIQDGLGHTLTVAAGADNSPFVFPQAVLPGVTYDVTVQTQPNTPPQKCRVSNGTGIMPAASVTNVAIRCVTPGKYLFAVVPTDTAAGTGSVAAFTIDPTSGELTAVAGSPYPTAQSHPSDIAIDPSGQYLYTANAGSNTLSTDLIGAHGVLTLDVSVAANVNSPLSVAVAPDGTQLFVGSASGGANGAIEAFALNGGVLSPALGTLAASTYATGNAPRSIAVAAATPYTKALLFAANRHDSTISDWVIGADGSLTDSPGSPFAFQNGPGSSSPFALAIYPGNNFLYVSDSTANTVSAYLYDVLGDQLTLIATYSTGALVQAGPEGLAIDPTGSFLYVACSGSVAAFKINSATGLLSLVGAFQTTGSASASTPTSVRVDPSSQFAYVSNGDAGTISVFRIDFDTGALMPAGAPVLARISNGGPSSMVIE